MDKINSNAANSNTEDEPINRGNRSVHYEKHAVDIPNWRTFKLHFLRRKGLAYEIISEEKQAYLLNLTENSKILFYILPLGCIQIGRRHSELQSSPPDIMLDSPTLDYNHCRIENIKGNLCIIPESKNFDTHVNGELIYNKTKLSNGDRLILGRSHYFAVLKQDRNKRKSKKVAINYHLAFNEVIQKQKEGIRVQLEEAMCETFLNKEIERYEHERYFKEQIEQLKMKIIILKGRIDICESSIQLIQSNTKPIEKSEILTPDLLLSTEATFKFIDNIQEIMRGPYKNQNLFKIELMMNAAAEYATNYELNYEFKYQQLVDEFGLHQQKILILDKKLNVMAIWPLSRLEVWLEIMRNNTYVLCNNNPFTFVNIEWQPIEIKH